MTVSDVTEVKTQALWFQSRAFQPALLLWWFSSVHYLQLSRPCHQHPHEGMTLLAPRKPPRVCSLLPPPQSNPCPDFDPIGKLCLFIFYVNGIIQYVCFMSGFLSSASSLLLCWLERRRRERETQREGMNIYLWFHLFMQSLVGFCTYNFGKSGRWCSNRLNCPARATLFLWD